MGLQKHMTLKRTKLLKQPNINLRQMKNYCSSDYFYVEILHERIVFTGYFDSTLRIELFVSAARNNLVCDLENNSGLIRIIINKQLLR